MLVLLATVLAHAACGGTTVTVPDSGGGPDASTARIPDGGAPASPDLSTTVLMVNAALNRLPLDACHVTPALLPDVPAGTYTIVLDESTLSKGNVTTTPLVASVDNYVVVQLPLLDDDPQADRRLFMLNGIGDNASFTLSTAGTIRVMFIDSDGDSNSGEAMVSVSPGHYSTTVSAVDNVLRWGPGGCDSTPAMAAVSTHSQAVKLVGSTLSWGPGHRGDHVLVRLPSITPRDDHRYVILNGVGANRVFVPSDSTSLRAWFISPGGGATGEATLDLSDD